MKLVPTNEKVQIKWFAILSDGSKYRNNQGFVHNAWDVECSCGWKTFTGGAIKSFIIQEVYKHKRFDHDYVLTFEKVGA